MENAAKALIIAAGVLLALMTLSIIVYMSTTTSRFMDEQDQKKLEQQIKAFNNEYESYNKKRMYGTDVITVVNKAINHNQKMDASQTSDLYYINVIIEITEPFSTTGIKEDNTKEKNNVSDMTSHEIATNTGKTIEQVSNAALSAGRYELGYWKKDELQMNKGIIDFFSENKEDSVIISDDKKTTYYIYSALTNFKRAIFTCTGTEYNEETGRIKSITFKQI